MEEEHKCGRIGKEVVGEEGEEDDEGEEEDRGGEGQGGGGEVSSSTTVPGTSIKLKIYSLPSPIVSQ